MIFMKCGDRGMNKALTEIYGGFTFIDSWFYLLILTIVANFYLDYCALYMSYGGTWGHIGRHAYRLLVCKPCRKGKKDI